MFTWGVIVFVGLWLILADLGAVRKAKLMGNPMLMHVIVIGSRALPSTAAAPTAPWRRSSAACAARSTSATNSACTATSARTGGIPACFAPGIHGLQQVNT